MHLTPIIRVVDDDRDLLQSLRACLSTFAWEIETYESAEAFLAQTDLDAPGCLILDVAMPGMKGTELQLELKRRGIDMPIIFLSGHGTIAMAVSAMARGASTFLEKPVEPQKLREAVVLAMSKLITIERETSVARDARARFDTLTEREKEIARLITKSLLNKTIADRLGISVTTVKTHRANVFAKLGVKSAVELTKLLVLIED
ncbi:response regulator transcription factor [Sutterella massiliensis]|uniref:Response regulator transcription factor n=1 Tax=Sutterella massiliensis TaxID=1816689 RepID=A0ABS2DT30_9BURK|nr:response regulator [Sutterella massiliensis]MBM6703870.1 response regulator transcription factor [Sutterella massiliensis]